MTKNQSCDDQQVSMGLNLSRFRAFPRDLREFLRKDGSLSVQGIKSPEKPFFEPRFFIKNML